MSRRFVVGVGGETVESLEDSEFIVKVEAVINADLRLDVLRGLAVAAIGGTLKDARDRALLLNGFAGGFRRSELIGIDCTDIETVRQGIVVHIRPAQGNARLLCAR